MTEVFVPLEQAATIEGIGYESMKKRVQRSASKYLTREAPRETGGRPCVMVALSSLSPKAKKAYKAALLADGGEAMRQDNPGESRPWYVDTDILWYMENHRAAYNQAIELKKEIMTFLAYDDAGRTAHAADFAQRLSISTRSLYRHAKEVTTAGAWANKIGAETGKSYDYLMVLCLCRKPRRTDNFPSLPEEQRAYLENIWFDKEFAKQSTVQLLYENFEDHAAVKGWVIPSYQTVNRYITYLMERQKYKNARVLLEKDLRTWKRDIMCKGLRDTSAVPVLGILQGDSHTFDFFVEYIDPSNGTVTAIRPTLVAWIDTRTRMVFGSLITKNPNQDIIKLSILKAIYQGGGCPQALLFDNGKDYTAHSITGRKRSEHSSHNALLTLDSEAQGFIRSAGILDDYRSLPYQPWSKGPIERFFGTVCARFSRWFTSYVGTLTASKTSSKIPKDCNKLLAQGKLVTMEECYELFETFLERYHNRAHRGLQTMGEQWTTPASLFANAENRYFKAPPAPELANMLLRRAENARVRSTGIHRFGSTYMDYALNEYINTSVNIRWNPMDMSKLYVYDLDGRLICEAEKQQLLRYNGYASSEEIEAHVRKQNRHLAAERAKVAKMQEPYEKRVGLPPVAGVPDFMIEGKRSKVVALPQDTQFAQEAKERRGRKKPSVENPFLAEKAEGALSKLREMA